MHHTRHIAIILSDTLRQTGIQYLLADYFPPVETACFHSFSAFAGTNDGFDYYFTDADTFMLHAEYFLPRKNKTMVLIDGQGTPCQTAVDTNNSGNAYLYTGAPQETLLEQIGSLFANEGHIHLPGENNKDLSARETDVLQLIVKGITNKEIADKLNISLNTVLTHRKNITSKLGIKTVSGLTFYAIMNGLISGDEIEP
ncbi:DNA-binding response regulator [Parabacteroides sp. 52]|uniref:response regulator transcription factor n=1 Tax=unclassified Parabacteroides TaxID=2649774 RepID=UPI0013D7E8BA|nr:MULTISPECIES: response regulator transcription factor [unclassified Parabacteroides]MDH6535642.1 DNA-binding CsgD family transcriptional regulator [Parabacteroides sp. PM5-20]NDV56281.1 DNA-binding response regulator [Parabacteroides sp. 52]